MITKRSAIAGKVEVKLKMHIRMVTGNSGDLSLFFGTVAHTQCSTLPVLLTHLYKIPVAL